MAEARMTIEIAKVWLGLVWPIWLVLAWLIGAVLTPYVARQKGYDAPSWCVVAIFASPVIALLALAALPPKGAAAPVALLADEELEAERTRRRETYRPFSG